MTIEERTLTYDCEASEFRDYFFSKFEQGFIQFDIPHALPMFIGELLLSGIAENGSVLKSADLTSTTETTRQYINFIHKLSSGRIVNHTHLAGYMMSENDPENDSLLPSLIEINNKRKGDVIFIDKAAKHKLNGDPYMRSFDFTSYALAMAPCFLISDKRDSQNPYKSDFRFKQIVNHRLTSKIWESNARVSSQGTYMWGYANLPTYFSIYQVIT